MFDVKCGAVSRSMDKIAIAALRAIVRLGYWCCSCKSPNNCDKTYHQ